MCSLQFDKAYIHVYRHVPYNHVLTHASTDFLAWPCQMYPTNPKPAQHQDRALGDISYF
jgi:hypothetical protein